MAREESRRITEGRLSNWSNLSRERAVGILDDDVSWRVLYLIDGCGPAARHHILQLSARDLTDLAVQDCDFGDRATDERLTFMPCAVQHAKNFPPPTLALL